MKIDKKIGIIDVILAYILLPVVLIYWGAVLIWSIQGYVNGVRHELEEAMKK